MRKPKLLFLVNEDSFFVSHRLELGLAARDAGFDVVVAAGEGGGREAIEGAGLRFVPVRFDRGGRSAVRDARTLASIAQLYRAERPTLAHHVTIKPVLYGSIVARTLHVPAVVNAVSGLGFVFLDPSRRGRALRLGIERAYRLALGHPTSATVFQNEDDLALFVKRRLVAAERATLVRGSGVDPARFPEQPLPDGDPVVLFPARLLWDKGIGELVDAARALRARGSRARFVIVGAADGTNPARVSRTTVERWTAEGIVEWWGARADMPEVYAQAHLVVLPSYREGLPLALLEAAATGRACVTTDVPGCRDAVEDGRTGWLVPARDSLALASAIERALADRPELVRRGTAAAARAREHFTKGIVVEAHLRLYRRLSSGHWPRALDPSRVAP